MTFNLSWDLFILVFFSIIIAYSFIIGRNQTLKVIISSYVAILAADGVGNLIERYFIGDQAILDLITLTNNPSLLVILKVAIFVTTIILITTRGRFHIDMGGGNSYLLHAILALTYGILSAGLIVSTILIYVSGSSLVQGGTAIVNETIMAMYRESFLVRAMIDNYNVWFSLPAITFVLSSLIREDD